MNNWRLLLLAVVVVVQPIGSFTESNLIDGRECCERSEDSRFYGYRKIEEHRTLDGNRENSRSNNERRLNLRDGNLDLRYETRRGLILTHSERSLERSEIRISPDLSRSTDHRFARDQDRRHREIRKDPYRDESRSSMGQVERNSVESRMRDTLDTARTDRRTRDARVSRSERESRNLMSRLLIPSSGSLEERRVSPNTETTITEERENIIRSVTRRDTRQSVPDRNRENRDFERRTREYSSEYRRADTRANDEVRHMQAQRRSVYHHERNNRESRVFNAELLRQRNTELRNRDRDISRDSERISADRMHNSRDDARIGRERMEARNDKKTDDRRQNRDDSRRLTDSTHERTTEERRLGFRQTRISKSIDMTRNTEQLERRSISMGKFSLRERKSERNARDERGTRNSDIRAHSEERQDTRKTNSRTDVKKSTEGKRLHESRDNSERTHESRRIAVRRIVREFDERRQHRDSRLSMDRTISMLRDVRNTDSRQESRMSRRDAREHSEDRILQRDNTRLSRDRTNSMLHEKREVLDTAVRIEELRRISSRNEMNSRRLLVSRNRLEIRNNIRSDLRRQVLERSMERTVRMTRSSEERRDINRETSRRSRSAEPLRLREETRGTEKDEHRQTRDQDRTVEQRVNLIVAIPQRLDTRRSSQTESMRLERVVRNSEDVRETRDQDRPIELQEIINVATSQQLDARRSSRTESIRRERRVQDRDVIRDNQRRVRDNEKSSRIISNHLSSDSRVLAERRLDNRETSKDSRDVRLMRNRVDVRSERVLAERMQENRETARDSRQVRVTRNPSQVRDERVLVERRQKDRESTRDLRNVLADARRERKQESRQIRDSRNIQDETRKQREVKNQPIQDSRDVRGEVRMDERLNSRRQRDATRDSRGITLRSLQRESRDAERITVKSSEVRQDRATRNIEREARLVRHVRAADVQRESRNDRTINMPMDRTSNRLTRDTRVAEREERFSHIDAVIFRDNLDKSDESVFNNWQMVFYTLQGVYLCGLLVQMFTENGNKTKKRTFNWWTSPKNLIKVD